MKIRYKGITFDDFVKDEFGVWSQICPDCMKRYGLKEGVGEMATFGSGICGVEGCMNSSEDEDPDTYYIDFDESEITYVEEG